MNWCAEHWQLLRQAVKDKGVWHLVSPTAEAAANYVMKRLESDPPWDDFDPLLESWQAINMAILEFDENAPPLKCPLCYLVEHGRPELVENWVDGATTDACDSAKDLGLFIVN